MTEKRAPHGKTSGLLEELAWRGLVHDQTPGLAERLSTGPITAYVGFDPTANSLQVGNLIPVMLLAHLQRMGGKPIVVVGGATGLIGDPSGKPGERPLLGEAEVAENVARQRRQFERFLDFGAGARAAEMVDNAEWLKPINLVAFLRDIGKHFTLSYMLQKESVKGRMDAGISYTEFSYMLLQAYDFLHVYRTRTCELQMGGSDQWGNITAGIELIRRVTGAEVHGLAAPLLATASGAKFGKTEAGTVWLDADLTSPYQFYQFWLNAADREVEGYLKLFTFKTQHEIAVLMATHARDPEARAPHRALAAEMTARVHGHEARERVEQASQVIFGELDAKTASAAVWQMLRAEVPSRPLPSAVGPDTPIVDLLGSTGVVKSKSEARRLIQQGGLYVNGERVLEPTSSSGDALNGGYYWIRTGKKTQFILYPPYLGLPEEP